jgi:katanin p60 ATPase-containing subunit A1
LLAEVKVVPDRDAPGAQVLLLLDVLNAGDMSSACDFAAVKLDFDKREIRVETYRPRSTPQTLYSIPNCAALKMNQYVSILMRYDHPDALSLKICGVTLTSNLRLGRVEPSSSGARRLGVGVYGKTRCMVRRFKVLNMEEIPKNDGCEDRDGRLETRRSSERTESVPRPTARGRMSDLPPAFPALPAPPGNLGQVPPSQVGEELDLVSMIERDIVVQSLDVTFEEIGGLADAKRAVHEAVTLPLLIPEFFTGLRKPWKGVLLFGPPGTGKAMLAKAVASSCSDVTFFNCSCATLTSKWRGESEKLLRALFTTARARAPAILFFDEVDSLFSQRGSAAEHEASRRFKSEFLIHMDGLLSDDESQGAGHVVVLATTNTPWDLDDALRRRLEKRIFVPLPDGEAREQMFKDRLSGADVADDVDPTELAQLTGGYSGSDIHTICRDAAMAPLRRFLDGKTPLQIKAMRDAGELQKPVVESKDFEEAIKATAPTVLTSDIEKYEAWDRELGAK